MSSAIRKIGKRYSQLFIGRCTSSRKMDYYKKLFKYRMAGVREYWVVDPDKKCVTVYHFELDNMEEYSFGDEVPAGIYEGFFIKIETETI